MATIPTEIPSNVPYSTTDFYEQLLPVVIGTYLSFILFGVSTLQFYYCAKLLKRSGVTETWNWVTLGIFLFFDVFDTIVKGIFFVDNLKSAVIHGLAAAYLPSSWTVYGFAALGGVIPFLVHIFYIRRIVRISRNWTYKYYVWGLLFACFVVSVNSVVFAFKAAGIGLRPPIEYFPDIKTVPIPWLAGDVAVDSALCLILIFYLTTQRSDFSHTNAIITKWIAISLETGLLPATIALADLLLGIKHPDKPYHLGANLVLAKVYINSVLVLFHTITRNRVKGSGSQMGSGSGPKYISKGSRAPLFSQSMAVSIVNANSIAQRQEQEASHVVNLSEESTTSQSYLRASTEKPNYDSYPSYTHSPKA